MFPTSPLSDSIGKKLLAARVARGLSVEDVAFKTHIPAARISELENDDFSNFANLTYAKGFLKLYSNFLEIDIASYLDQINTSDFANISGHDYIQSANTGMTAMSMAVAPRRSEGRGNGLILTLIILAAMIGLPIWYWSRSPHEPETPVQAPTQQGPIPKAKPYVEPSENADPQTPATPSPSNTAPKPKILPEEIPPPPGTRQPEIRPAGIRAKVIPEDEPAAPPANALNGASVAPSIPDSPAPVILPAIVAATEPAIEIELGVVPMAMKFDKTAIEVVAGRPVKIFFSNQNDPLQHNLLVLKSGSKNRIGLLADRMLADPEGLKKNYIPVSDDILAKSSKLIGNGQSDLIQFTAPSEPGDYPYVCTFPGHWRLMSGVMKVVLPAQTEPVTQKAVTALETIGSR